MGRTTIKMMNIVFKDVGQGDSIILQWQDEGINKIGVIDCNKPNKEWNPVLEHLKLIGDFSFDFLILSHPHEDHYSGMMELLEYVDREEIKIGTFYHTSSTTKEYLTSYAKSAANTKLLKNIFSFAYHLYSKGLIGEYGSVDRMTGVRALNKEFNMQFLFPSEKYYQLYNRVAYSQWEGNNNPNANLLCTVIRIYSSEVSYILTSDAVQKVFKELYQKCPIRDQLIKAAQVSHHGAGGNFDRGFWKSVRNANKSQYAIVSVGQNDYGHPEEEAMNELSKSGYEVKYTNPPEFWKATSHHPLSLIGTRVSKGRDDFEGKDIIVN